MPLQHPHPRFTLTPPSRPGTTPKARPSSSSIASRSVPRLPLSPSPVPLLGILSLPFSPASARPYASARQLTKDSHQVRGSRGPLSLCLQPNTIPPVPSEPRPKNYTLAQPPRRQLHHRPRSLPHVFKRHGLPGDLHKPPPDPNHPGRASTTTTSTRPPPTGAANSPSAALWDPTDPPFQRTTRDVFVSEDGLGGVVGVSRPPLGHGVCRRGHVGV